MPNTKYSLNNAVIKQIFFMPLKNGDVCELTLEKSSKKFTKAQVFDLIRALVKDYDFAPVKPEMPYIMAGALAPFPDTDNHYTQIIPWLLEAFKECGIKVLGQ